jgi:hypothetical protein
MSCVYILKCSACRISFGSGALEPVRIQEEGEILPLVSFTAFTLEMNNVRSPYIQTPLYGNSFEDIEKGKVASEFADSIIRQGFVRKVFGGYQTSKGNFVFRGIRETRLTILCTT